MKTGDVAKADCKSRRTPAEEAHCGLLMAEVELVRDELDVSERIDIPNMPSSTLRDSLGGDVIMERLAIEDMIDM